MGGLALGVLQKVGQQWPCSASLGRLIWLGVNCCHSGVNCCQSGVFRGGGEGSNPPASFLGSSFAEWITTCDNGIRTL